MVVGKHLATWASLGLPHLLRQREESGPADPQLTVCGARLLSEVGAIRNSTLQMGSEPKVM